MVGESGPLVLLLADVGGAHQPAHLVREHRGLGALLVVDRLVGDRVADAARAVPARGGGDGRAEALVGRDVLAALEQRRGERVYDARVELRVAGRVPAGEPGLVREQLGAARAAGLLVPAATAHAGLGDVARELR